MSDRVSLVIPAYNAGRFISRALTSVENQTRKPDELVVVDDGSTDDTAAQVRSFVRKSKLNVIFEQQSNQGSASARNRGVGRTTGDVIAFLDADDIIYPHFLELTVSGLVRNPGWVACFGDRDVLDMHGRVIAKDLDHHLFKSIRKKNVGDGFIEIDDDAFFLKMLRGSVIPMTCAFRRHDVLAVDGFDASIRFHEDKLFMLRLIKRGKFGYVDKPLGTWLRHDSNKTASVNALKGAEGSDQILARIIEDKDALQLSPQELAEAHAARRELAGQWLYAASRARSAATFSLGWRFWVVGWIKPGTFLRAIARYLAALLRM